MSTSLSFPIARILFIAVAFLATVFWARRAVQITPTTDMISYVSRLLECDRAWKEDDEQLKNISGNMETTGNTWYLYHKEATLELHFMYTKSERTESYRVFCITEWASGIIKADFVNGTLSSGSFNEQMLKPGKDHVLQAELGTMLKSIRFITDSRPLSSRDYQIKATSLA